MNPKNEKLVHACSALQASIQKSAQAYQLVKAAEKSLPEDKELKSVVEKWDALRLEVSALARKYESQIQ